MKTKCYRRVTGTKYLGVLLDNKLNWMDHISKTAKITNKRLELIRRLAGTKLGITQDKLNITYNTYIKPVMKYSSEVIDTTNKANLHHLETEKNNALSLICGTVKTTPVTALQLCTENLPISLEIQKQAAVPSLNYKLLPGQVGSTNIPHIKLSKPNLHQ